MRKPTLAAARRWYAEDLRVTAPILRTPRLVEAFAAVPREEFLGPGPWRILPDGRFDAPYDSPDADPRILYHAVLVAIDGARDLNNGSPRLWAYLFDVAELKPGARILQVGAGTGYYTAVLAADGTTYDPGRPVDAVIAFAGGTPTRRRCGSTASTRAAP